MNTDVQRNCHAYIGNQGVVFETAEECCFEGDKR